MRSLRYTALLILACILLAGVPASAGAPGSVTVMVYVCGSDLENLDASGTDDIKEMLDAQTDNINIIVETGGSKSWDNPDISGGVAQRFIMDGGSLELLEDLGRQNMADPATLGDFIAYCGDSYPADRNILVLWDHGGGSAYGYASDDLFDGDYMPIDEIAAALEYGGVRFDFIGFDACLMASYEVGLALAPYADYLIASEETEPGDGWSYTGWLSALDENAFIETVDLAEILIGDYLEFYKDDPDSADATLSMIDLSVVSALADGAVAEFAREAQDMLTDGKYAALANARSDTRAYGYEEHGMVDFADLVLLSGVDGAEELAEEISGAVVINGTSRLSGNSCGLSVYFPYDDPEMLDSLKGVYEDAGSGDYYNLLAGFSTARSDGSTSGDYSGSSWYDQLVSGILGDYIEDTQLSEDGIELAEKDGGYVIRLSDDDWDLVTNVRIQLNAFDDEGQVVLGFDDVVDYSGDEDGDVPVEFDGTWVALNGQIVPFYSTDYIESGDYYRYVGYVPVEVDGEDLELVVIWDSDDPDGRVLGLRPQFSDSQTIGHGLRTLSEDDVLKPYCEYYYDDSDEAELFYYGDPIECGDGIAVSYEDAGAGEFSVCYVLTDIYGNDYYTEFVNFE